eukprot:GILI01012556.1.p2 GENE.GILI01012556.1~~GILI01012556.1.p2  ORF type:complete len:186 (-),score=25.07 GILI01012556.1:270-827(-)
MNHFVEACRRFRLRDQWNIWYDSGRSQPGTLADYEKGLVLLASFNSVQDFWMCWNNLDLSRVPEFANLGVFKAGITPTWEHPCNKQGGRWLFKCGRSESEERFCSLVLALIGQQFSGHSQLNGAVFSVRPRANMLAIWGASVDPQLVYSTEEELRDHINLPDSLQTEFRDHQGSLDVSKRIPRRH